MRKCDPSTVIKGDNDVENGVKWSHTNPILVTLKPSKLSICIDLFDTNRTKVF